MSQAVATRSALIDLTVPRGGDVAEHVHAAAMRIVPLVEEESDPDVLLDYLSRWEAFVAVIESRKRRARGQSEAVARMIEIRLAEVMDGVPQNRWPDEVSHNMITELRTMLKFRDIAEKAIAESTNAQPATRWRVCEAIRAHRVGQGELLPRPHEARRAEAEERFRREEAQRLAKREAEMRRQRAEAEKLREERRAQAMRNARTVGPRAERIYSLARRLSAEAAALDAGSPNSWNWVDQIGRGARLVEEAVQALMRAEAEFVESAGEPI